MTQISWDEFEKVELRVGIIIKVEDFPEAKKPAYKLLIDFGELGVKKSSAQITALYRKEELLGKQVICVTNFFPKQIGSFVSEVLTENFAKLPKVLYEKFDRAKSCHFRGCKFCETIYSNFSTTGFVLDNGEVVLAVPERKVGNGLKLA